MYLYHYSGEFFNSLMTRRASGAASLAEIKSSERKAKELNLEAPYVDHISFFFDPIPASYLPTVFPKNHQTWVKGKHLYEYVVNVDDIVGQPLYRVVESVRKTELLKVFSKENDWTTDDPAILKKWLKLADMMQREWGELGNDPKILRNQIQLNSGKILEYYKAAVLDEDFEYNKMKYAANVPHLMLYPIDGEVKFDHVNSLVMGNDKRTPVVKVKPPSRNW